jgi:hypothetical protein
MLPAHFALVILEMGSSCLGQHGPQSSELKIPAFMYAAHAQLLSVKMGSHELFTQTGLEGDPSNLRYPVARITGISHWHLT